MPWSNSRPRSGEYGHAHATEAQRRKAILTEADACGYCGRPLGPRQMIDPRTGRRIGLWHLPHSADRSHYLPGMWHKRCNEREAAVRARARQNSSSLRW
jgi:hypothetical protein